jgi:hypothetical protein
MNRFLLVVTMLFFSTVCGDAYAQFKNPPPDRPPPVCPVLNGISDSAEPNAGGVQCAEGHPFDTRVSCRTSYGSMECAADVRILLGGVWVPLPPAPNKLIFDWAFIVDGQEYYLNPTYENSISFACGYSPHVIVRVTAATKTVIQDFKCPGFWYGPPVEPPIMPPSLEY